MAETYWTADSGAYLEPKVALIGQGSTPPRTVFDMFKEVVFNYPNRPALHFKEIKTGSSTVDQKFSVYTWNEYYTKVLEFAKSLIQIGVCSFDNINIIGFNSKEWFISHFGAIAAGAIPAGIYPSNLPDACKYISNHSQAKVVCLEDNKQLKKYIEVGSDELPFLKAIVVWNEEPLVRQIGEKTRCYSWNEFIELGKKSSTDEVEDRIDGQCPGNCCSLIYTSGTTGPPKAVMISHDNVTWTVHAMLQYYPLGSVNDRGISYLPLSHIAAQILDFYIPMHNGSSIYFAQPDALKGSLGVTLKEVRPTYFFGVPRVWEKIYDKMQEVAKSTTGLKKGIATWAKSRGSEKSRLSQYGQGGGAPWGYGLASSVVLKKVKQALGLDKCNYFFVGAAPMAKEIFNYFASLDIPIFEQFGLSECTGMHSLSSPFGWKIGAVGRPLIGTENKIDKETGELCFRGRHVFMGYMKMPEKTRETIDIAGWLHTGDIAKFDNDSDNRICDGPSGFLYITGRIKELIITAGGENVPPVLIEDAFKKAMPALSNCLVVGDKKKYLGILLTLQLEIKEDGTFSDKLTGESLATSIRIGSSATTIKQVQGDRLWNQYFDEGLAKANEEATSNAQKVKQWGLLLTDFSESGGMLTPTLKLKRSKTIEIFKENAELLYSEHN
mmetsp:Transcript_32803/g.43169  ORF Transcript_32803/g.43169 Transcript_32803/m.43169 type:complete len:665 (-) Transcript_32803:392-2386(-)